MNQSVNCIPSQWKIFAIVERIGLKRLSVRFCASRHLKRQVVDSASLISIISCHIQFTIEPLHITSHCFSSQCFAGILSLPANTIVVSIHFYYLFYSKKYSYFSYTIIFEMVFFFAQIGVIVLLAKNSEKKANE